MSIRKIAVGASTGLYVFLLCMAIATAGIVLVINSPLKVETAVSQSGLYKNLVTGIINENQQTDQNQTSNIVPLDTIPINDSDVQSAIQKAFPPQLLERDSDSLIDSLYPWLQGQSSVPDFNIDLTSAKKTFAGYIGDIVQKRLSALPTCTITPVGELDPFGATCSPGADNIPSISQAVVQAVSQSDNFLPSADITATTFTASNGQPLFEQLRALPGYYQTALTLPYIFVALALVTAFVNIIGSEERRETLQRLSYITIGIGVFFIVSAALFNSLLQHFADSFAAEPDSKFFTQEFTQIFNQVSRAIVHEYWLIGGASIALGIVVLLIAHLIHFRFQPEPIVATNTSSAPVEKA